METSKLGRPRSFDADEALDRALEVFWRRGYEGASITELTEAMGITRPSLYAAYGSKEELFGKVLDRYEAAAAESFAVLDEPNAREAVARCLAVSIRGLCSDSLHRGCLLVRGALACSEESEKVRQEVAARRTHMEDLLRNRLIRAREEGELPSDLDPADLARYFATVLHGLSVQAAGGASVDELQKVANAAMRVWPL